MPVVRVLTRRQSRPSRVQVEAVGVAEEAEAHAAEGELMAAAWRTLRPTDP